MKRGKSILLVSGLLVLCCAVFILLAPFLSVTSYPNARKRMIAYERMVELAEILHDCRGVAGTSVTNVDDVSRAAKVDLRERFQNVTFPTNAPNLFAHWAKPLPRIRKGEWLPPKFRDKARHDYPPVRVILYKDGVVDTLGEAEFQTLLSNEMANARTATGGGHSDGPERR